MAIFMVACNKDEISLSDEKKEKLSISEINTHVFDVLKKDKIFKWESVDDHFVWSALVQSDEILSIGYKPENVGDVHSIIHEIDINDEAWTAAREKVLEAIKQELKDDPNFVEERDIYIKDVLPVIIVKTNSLAVVKILRAMTESVRYVEPMGYTIEPDQDNTPEGEIGERSDSGCGSLNTATGIYSNDYYSLPPYNNKVPWTYTTMNVDDAWSISQGDNITVAMFDTGTSDGQYKLRGGFNNNYSSGRYISPRSTHYTTTGIWWWRRTTLDSPNDQCGHGTQMSGNIAAPRSSGTSVVGVAYKANLLAYRVTEDVIIGSSSEKDGVSDAFVQVAQEGDAKIVSMSLGDIFHSSQVEDAIEYAYNHGILIFAAAGTSLTWTNWYGVIFPAYLSETVAITGVTDQTNYSRCSTCHDGSQVDFVVKMERSSTRRGLTLKMSGNDPTWVGGSSIATAQTAGVAALIWATNPNSSRATVLNRMKNASQNYPGRSSRFGWGTYDVLQAVQ